MLARAAFKAISLLLVPCTACSLVAVHGLPDRPPPPSEPLECTRDSGAPALDTAGAIAFTLPVLLGVAGMIALATSDSCGPETYGGCGAAAARLMLVGLGSAAVATPLAISAATGYSRMNRCRDAQEGRALAALYGQLPEPWDAALLYERLTYNQAAQACSGRHERLPSRAEAEALSSELHKHAFVQPGLQLWIREIQLRSTGEVVDPYAPGYRGLVVEAHDVQPRAFDLQSARVDSEDADAHLRTVCIRDATQATAAR